MEEKKFRFPLFQLICIIVLVVLDQLSKFKAVESLKDAPAHPIVTGVLELQYLENRGAAFGVLQNRMGFFVIITVVVLAAVMYVIARMPAGSRYMPLNVLLTFVAAGAVGNLIDRLRLGYVVDFIYFVPINFPIFNVADMYVTVSMFCLIYLLLFYYKDDELKRIL